MISRRALSFAVAAVATAAATPAHADTPVAEITRDTPIAALDGTVAWSHYDAASNRFRLLFRRDGVIRATAVVSREPLDVGLGRDGAGALVAVYTRRAAADSSRDIYRYEIGSRREQKVRSASSQREDEGLPVLSEGRLAFVRRRPTGGKGRIRDCDVPFVKVLTSRAPSKRLDRGACGRTTGLSLRGRRLVQVTIGAPQAGRRIASQVRALSVRGGRSRVLAERGFGYEPNVYASPSQSARSVWVTRNNSSDGSRFVRISVATGRLVDVPSQLGLTGPLVRDERGRFWYVEGLTAVGCTDQAPLPCRLVEASADPTSATVRTLAPGMSISGSADTPGILLYGDPFKLSGLLTRTVVRGGQIVRIERLAGVALRILRRVGDPSSPGLHERFAATDIVTTTRADGTWSVPIANPPPLPWFSAVTLGDPIGIYAGRGTIGTIAARIALTVNGSAFSGTVAPAQPGRSVKIQRLTSPRCFGGPPGPCMDTWVTVAEAPLAGPATAYAATVAAPAPGNYRALLPLERNSYAGVSPEVQVGG